MDFGGAAQRQQDRDREGEMERPMANSQCIQVQAQARQCTVGGGGFGFGVLACRWPTRKGWAGLPMQGGPVAVSLRYSVGFSCSGLEMGAVIQFRRREGWRLEGCSCQVEVPRTWATFGILGT